MKQSNNFFLSPNAAANGWQQAELDEPVDTDTTTFYHIVKTAWSLGKNEQTEYTIKKRMTQPQLNFLGARVGEIFGNKTLIIPTRNGDNSGFQVITEDGKPLAIKNGDKIAGKRTIPHPDNVPPNKLFTKLVGSVEVIDIAEGLATSASSHLATGNMTFFAGNCGNLPACAKLVKEQYPSAKIRILGDNDPLPLSAHEAARLVHGKVSFPDSDLAKGYDWNDYYCSIEDNTKALKATKRAIDDAESKPMTVFELLIEYVNNTDAEVLKGSDKINWLKKLANLSGKLEAIEQSAIIELVAELKFCKAKDFKKLVKDQNPKLHGGKLDGAGRPKLSGLVLDDYTELFADWGYNLAFNELDDTIEDNGEKMSDSDTDILLALAHDHCELNELKQQTPQAKRAITVIARQHCYNPIKNYLESLQWDGKSNHIQHLANHFTDEDKKFSRWLELWIIGAVAKVYENYQNPMLTLMGEQEIGKSYFARWITPHCLRRRHFAESQINPEDKDHVLKLANTFIWEVGELTSTVSRRDINSLKQFLTMQSVNVRKAYGRIDIHKDTICSFVGTDNDLEILRDRTGNRRYLMCNITNIDQTYSQKVSLDGIWGQAVAMYQQSDDWRMTKAEKRVQKEQNEQYNTPDPDNEWLYQNLEVTNDPSHKLTFGEVWHRWSDSVAKSQKRICSFALSRWCKGNNVASKTIRRGKIYFGVKLRKQADYHIS